MTRIALIVIGMVLGTALSFLGFSYTIGDGGYSLSVFVRTTAARPVQKISCCTFGRSEYAAAYYEDDRGLEGYRGARFDTDNPFTGRPLTVDVPVSIRTTFLGLRDTYFQYELLVVVVEYQDGTRESKVVRIPDGRKTRTMSVTMP